MFSYFFFFFFFWGGGGASQALMKALMKALKAFIKPSEVPPTPPPTPPPQKKKKYENKNVSYFFLVMRDQDCLFTATAHLSQGYRAKLLSFAVSEFKLAFFSFSPNFLFILMLTVILLEPVGYNSILAYIQ